MRLFIREKILIVEKTHDKKKEKKVKPKISGEFQQKYLGFSGLRRSSRTFIQHR